MMTEVLLAVVQSGRFVADLDDRGKFLKNFCALCAQANFESDLEKYVAGPSPAPGKSPGSSRYSRFTPRDGRAPQWSGAA